MFFIKILITFATIATSFMFHISRATTFANKIFHSYTLAKNTSTIPYSFFFSMASSTNSAITTIVSIFNGIFVPMRTVCFSCIICSYTIATKHIFSLCNNIHMVWINAISMPAKMVYNKIMWYFSKIKLISKSMCTNLFLNFFIKKQTIPIGCFTCFPEPTFGSAFYINLIPETINQFFIHTYNYIIGENKMSIGRFI